MTERGFGVKSGANKQGWESTEFPIVCETCLGDNPYLRMLKQHIGKECKICSRPFTVFKWKAGTKGRFKKTEICQTCSRLKNVCQTCLYDLQYGLPVEIRDKFLGKAKVNIPECEGNRDYWAQLATQNMDNLALPYNQPEGSNPILEKIARNNPRYARNLPQPCSFFQKGTCIRGKECPYRHIESSKLPHTKDHRSIKDRFFGYNDPVARRILNQIENSKFLRNPKDQSIRTLVVFYADSAIDAKLKTLMEAYGEVEDYSMINNHVFITYKERKDAEKAIKNTYSSLVVEGRKLTVVWAKKTSEDVEGKLKAVLNLPEFSLTPSFSQNLKEVNAPKPPSRPPVELQSKKDRAQHMINMMKSSAGEGAQYSTTQVQEKGGKKRNINFNLVDY